MNSTSAKFNIINEILNSKDNVLILEELCAVSGVSRSGYYNWINSSDKRNEKELADQDDFEKILEAFKHRGYDKGVRGIHMRLLHLNPPVLMNAKKIKRLMGKYGLLCPIRKANPYRRMAKALKTSNYAENLVKRQFEDHGARAILLTDISYLPYNNTNAYISTIHEVSLMDETIKE